MKNVVVSVLLLFSLSAHAEPKKLLIYNFAEQTYENAFTAVAKEMGVELELNHDNPAILMSNLKDPNLPEKPDLVLNFDALSFNEFSKAGLLAPIHSARLEAAVPAQFRKLEDGWLGLSYHARTMVVNPQVPGIEAIQNYEHLADPRWKGQVCLRHATHTYTRALIASLLFALGEELTEKMLAGWVANNDDEIFKGDLYVLQAIEAGDCAVGLVNSDYFGRYTAQYPDSPLQLRWANQSGRGAHLNISGMAMLKQSTRSALAQEFLERSAESAEAMIAFADAKKDYPANPAFQARSGIVEKFGPFKGDVLSVSEIAARDEAAKAVAKKVGYNP
ncbi:MAG TPA: ABC transporter substrate-binding protein [Bdellovibrionota bacterium]|jgi:iron(III) transport system substrate-binding protein